MIGMLIVFIIFVMFLLHDKSERRDEEKAYNNGYCPKCGKRMRTLEDDWGNTTGFGCVCGHRTSDRYIGSDLKHIHKK